MQRMAQSPLKARDLLPLVRRLSHAEQLRLVELALHAAASNGDDAEVYRAAPPRDDEFSSDDDPLAWEADGWEEFSAPR